MKIDKFEDQNLFFQKTFFSFGFSKLWNTWNKQKERYGFEAQNLLKNSIESGKMLLKILVKNQPKTPFYNPKQNRAVRAKTHAKQWTDLISCRQSNWAEPVCNGSIFSHCKALPVDNPMRLSTTQLIHSVSAVDSLLGLSKANQHQTRPKSR